MDPTTATHKKQYHTAFSQKHCRVELCLGQRPIVVGRHLTTETSNDHERSPFTERSNHQTNWGQAQLLVQNLQTNTSLQPTFLNGTLFLDPTLSDCLSQWPMQMTILWLEERRL